MTIVERVDPEVYLARIRPEKSELQREIHPRLEIPNQQYVLVADTRSMEIAYHIALAAIIVLAIIAIYLARRK